MNRIVPILLLALTVYAGAFAQQAVTVDTAILQAGDYFIANLPRNSIVAILNIESDIPAISIHIMEELSAVLVNDRSLIVVERRNLDLIRQEEGFQLSGEVSDETARRIGYKLGAQTIISGSFARVGSQYRMRIRAIAVETAQVQGIITIPVRTDKVLRGLEQEGGVSGGNSLWDSLHDTNRLYLGARTGLSYGFYDNGGGLLNRTEFPSQTLAGNPAFDAALFASVSVWSLFAVQAEAVITNDWFDLSSGSRPLMSVSYKSMMFPLLAKAVWRPSVFMLQGYAGAYLSLPMGQVEVKHSNGSYSAGVSVPPGFIAGGGFGMKLGPGTVAADIRYAADFGNTAANYNGIREISRRSKVFFALGYELGLVPKK